MDASRTGQRYPERENFLRVIRRDRPSHVCWRLPLKHVSYHGAWPYDSRPSEDVKEWRDIWGVTWRETDGNTFPSLPALRSIDDLDQLVIPNLDRPDRMERVRQIAAAVDRRTTLLSVAHPYLLYEKSLNILGPEEFLTSLAEKPDAAEDLLDRLLGFELAVASRYVLIKPDGVHLSDDYGTQDRLCMSPAMWRRFFKPRLTKIIAFYRQALGPDTIFSLHSCGHVMPILEDLMELGIHLLGPVQSRANDLAEMRRRTSRRLTLVGGIDGQRLLPLGTPEEVRRTVFARLDLLWENGGYIPMAEKVHGVPPENRRAVEEAAEEWSRRNVEQQEADRAPGDNPALRRSRAKQEESANSDREEV